MEIPQLRSGTKAQLPLRMKCLLRRYICLPVTGQNEILLRGAE